MFLTGGFDGFDVLTAGYDVLTGGFDGFDVLTAGFDSRFWWFWQVVFVFEGCIINDRRFDGFDVLTGGFVFEGCIINDRRFWWFWCFDSRFWCFDSRFCWFWQVVLMVLMFWQQVLMILTGGFCFWRLYNNDRRFCLLKTLLSGNFPPTRGCVSMAVLWRLFTAVNKKLIVYKNSLLKKSTEHYFSLKSLTTHVTLFTSCFVNLTNVITFKMYDLI